jgi:hypothetical protein
VLAADGLYPCKKAGCGYDVAALTLHRLYQHGGRFLRRSLRGQDVAQLFEAERFGLRFCPAIVVAVWIGRHKYARHQRLKP